MGELIVDRLEKHLCAAVKASLTGKGGTPPEAGLPLWNAFQRLSAMRTYHAAGPNPIQPSEVAAWCSLMRVPFQPRHIKIIFAMDAEWLDQAYARTKAPAGVTVLAPVSKTPISAALLDAMMG